MEGLVTLANTLKRTVYLYIVQEEISKACTRLHLVFRYTTQISSQVIFWLSTGVHSYRYLLHKIILKNNPTLYDHLEKPLSCSSHVSKFFIEGLTSRNL